VGDAVGVADADHPAGNSSCLASSWALGAAQAQAQAAVIRSTVARARSLAMVRASSDRSSLNGLVSWYEAGRPGGRRPRGPSAAQRQWTPGPG